MSAIWFRLPLAVMGVGLCGLGWAAGVEPRLLFVREAGVELANWPSEPLRVALIADLHVGSPGVDPARVEAIAGVVTAAKPDLVLLLGDYDINAVPGGRHVATSEWAPFLGRIPAPLGVHAVLGNHDWWNDEDLIKEALQEEGIAVHDNGAVALRSGDQTFWLVGVGDLLTRHAAVEAALYDVPRGAPVLAMSHGPDVASSLAGRAELLVAGHTHGGQVNIPWVTEALLGRMSWYGQLTVDGLPVYVTSGIGTSVLPIRFNRPPEVVILTITAARPTPRT